MAYKVCTSRYQEERGKKSREILLKKHKNIPIYFESEIPLIPAQEYIKCSEEIRNVFEKTPGNTPVSTEQKVKTRCLVGTKDGKPVKIPVGMLSVVFRILCHLPCSDNIPP